MFDITSDEIAALSDEDLRTLVARLCEAELANRGFSTSAVTWGGNQTAPDGGLDVRVELPANSAVDGFIPRRETGFQVKRPDMPRAAILEEMRPGGVVRPAIQEIADRGGAYIIVSSTGSTSDSTLQKRRNALREAVADLATQAQLHTDFYDRSRLATWTRAHAGLVAWVKERIGRGFTGWHPYGAWTGAIEGRDADYILDDKLRLHFEDKIEELGTPAVQSIDLLRDKVRGGSKIVRLVGLSGVGKTRLAQALFDDRVGSRALPSSHAIYTNLSDSPNPQPVGLASDLVASRMRAVLIVDNCPPDLHRRLAELCGAPDSTVSVMTIEYDIRDDQPEGTQVVRLDTASTELIEKLLLRRFPEISSVDASTIANASGGNARIAIALAGTLERSETISGLTDEELFQRLFRQRHEPDEALHLAAQVCSLVYSFDGETRVGDDAELPRLAALIDQSPMELVRHVAELERRDLLQRRSKWRAVLPHALANRFAAMGLQNVPVEVIQEQFVTHGTARLARSFSRRLSFLHENRQAIAIARSWLSPKGILGNVALLNELGIAMFENVAPVLPDMALTALERVPSSMEDRSAVLAVLSKHIRLLRSLAYEPALFDRCVSLISTIAAESDNDYDYSMQFFEQISDHRHPVADSIPLNELLAWCDDAPQTRYPLAAYIITFARQTEQDQARVWSEEAKILFSRSPDPRTVLRTYIQRFRPRSWSGSRASIMESNAPLLDDLEGLIPSDVLEFARQEKTRLMADVEKERQFETDREKDRNERFE